jgi:hypothetical protein
MAVRVAPKTETVARCVPRQDGGYLIVTRKGTSAVSLTEISEGTPVVIRDGKAERSYP